MTSSRGHAAEQEGRRLALAAVFEAEFGQRTARRALERRIEDEGAEAPASGHAGAIVEAVTANRDTIDALITRVAPQYPVTQLARIDRALMRCALGELLHCPTTPTRVAIAEWVELARTYSGEPARRLLNGVLGRVASEATSRGRELSASDNGNDGGGDDRHTGGST
jgi:transcription antitermination protein NusB